MKFNQDKLAMLDKYKDDMERDAALKGEELMNEIRKVQIEQARNKELENVNKELQNTIKELEDRYVNIGKLESGTQTHDFDFPAKKISFASCQTDWVNIQAYMGNEGYRNDEIDKSTKGIVL